LLIFLRIVVLLHMAEKRNSCEIHTMGRSTRCTHRMHSVSNLSHAEHPKGDLWIKESMQVETVTSA
jgi:hypothetical protein